MFFFQKQEHALNMFTGTDQVGPVIGAGAGVVEFFERPYLHTIVLPRDR